MRPPAAHPLLTTTTLSTARRRPGAAGLCRLPTARCPLPTAPLVPEAPMRREPGHPVLDFDDALSGRDAEPPRRGARLAVIAVLAGAVLVGLAVAAFAWAGGA